jgi:ribose transport system permease protein
MRVSSPVRPAEPAPPVSDEPRPGVADWFLARARGLTPLLTLTVLVVFFSLTSERFLDPDNLRNILVQVSPIAVAATGLTFVVLCAEIDLSFANIATMSGIVMAAVWATDRPMLAIPLALLAAVVLGMLNGMFTARFAIPSFMVTLAMMQISEGVTIYISKGKPYFEVPEVLKQLGGGRIGPVPVLVLVAAAVLLVGHLVLTYTRFGRYVYMTGGNREAAELAGVRVRRVVLICLTVSALTGAMAGLLLVGRLDSAQPGMARDMLLNGIAAVVLGGTSLFGGEGGVKNTVVGLLIFGVLSNGLDLLPNIDVYLKTGIQGAILLAALVINVLALKLGNTRTRTTRTGVAPTSTDTG